MHPYVVLLNDGVLTEVRHLNFSDFRETVFSAKSFIEPDLQAKLIPGKFFFIRLDPKQNYKVCHVLEMAPDHATPKEYLELIEALQASLKIDSDPIVHLKNRADRLRIMKGRDNDFFKSKAAVFTWLVKKTLLAN
jgi:hypothetical protein